MKNFSLRVVIVLSVLLVSLSFLTTMVYGDTKFSDLNEENVYYDSIMELVNEGVISGYSDGTFKPDKNILICEAITIVEKVFGNPDNLPEWSKWQELTDTGYIYKTDWEIDYRMFFNKYFGGVNWELGSHFVLSSNKIELLDSEVFGYSNDCSHLSNIQLRGYTITEEPYRFMTRAEFCDLVVWAKYNINNTPDYSVNFPIKYSYLGYEDLEERKVYETYVLGAFLKAPDWLLNFYNKKNGRIVIVEESKWDFENHKDSVATYRHTNSGPLISIRDISQSTAFHELGHFVWFYGHLSLPNGVYEKESNELVNILLSDYCKKNKEEYFAEAFQAYFLHPVMMEKKCPDTYKFIKGVCEKLEEKYK